MTSDELKKRIIDVRDFPRTGVTFRDLTGILSDWAAFAGAMDLMMEASGYGDVIYDKVASIEARGFIFGPALALEIEAGFVPIRKKGKLPRPTISSKFALEYGEDEVHVHVDALFRNDSVLIVDDVLATGGTALAAAKLVEALGGTVERMVFLVELVTLGGRGKLGQYRVESVVKYE